MTSSLRPLAWSPPAAINYCRSYRVYQDLQLFDTVRYRPSPPSMVSCGCDVSTVCVTDAMVRVVVDTGCPVGQVGRYRYPDRGHVKLCFVCEASMTCFLQEALVFVFAACAHLSSVRPWCLRSVLRRPDMSGSKRLTSRFVLCFVVFRCILL